MAHHPRESAAEPVSDRRAAVGAIWRRARARPRPRRGDESGGAISLWVVLMVPVSAFAAVVAMAGPQRLAAESTMQDATDDLADFAVAWREGHDTPTGQLRAFPPECAARTDQENADLAALRGDIATLASSGSRRSRRCRRFRDAHTFRSTFRSTFSLSCSACNRRCCRLRTRLN